MCGFLQKLGSSEPTAADERRSWPGARTRLTEKTLSVANALSARTAGRRTPLSFAPESATVVKTYSVAETFHLAITAD